jgi:hypothetical protein
MASCAAFCHDLHTPDLLVLDLSRLDHTLDHTIETLGAQRTLVLFGDRVRPDTGV